MIRRYRPSDLERLKAITVVGFEGVSIDHGMEKVFGRLGRTDWKWRKARSIEWDVQADAVFVFHASPGGKTEQFCRQVVSWGKPLKTFACKENEALLALGAVPVGDHRNGEEGCPQYDMKSFA